MSDYVFENPLVVQVAVLNTQQLRAIYRFLADMDAIPENASAAEKSSQTPTPTPADLSPGIGQDDDDESEDTVEVDAAGTPFDPERHTGTKLKSGLWRMKKGEERLPEEEVVEDVSAAALGGWGLAPSATDAGEETANDADESSEMVMIEDDEFSSFREAATEMESNEAEMEVPARTWTDADLGTLLNEAALKLGSPDKIIALISEYVPEGETSHSRNIPEDVREEFAQKIEELADIEFAG